MDLSAEGGLFAFRNQETPVSAGRPARTGADESPPKEILLALAIPDGDEFLPSRKKSQRRRDGVPLSLRVC